MFCWWVELCSLPAIYLGPNYGGGNEDNGDLLQNIPCWHCYTQCPQPCSRPPPTHASAGDSWTLTGKSGIVSCGVTAHFSWVLVPKVFLCPPRGPVLCKFWQLYGGVNGDLLQEGLCHTQVCCTQRPCPCGSPLLTRTSTGDAQTQFCLSLCGVLVHTRFVWALSASLAGMEFDSKHEFTPPTVLLGLLLCPWIWGISSQLLQHLPSYWGFSNLWLLILEMLTRTTRKEYISLWTRSGYYRDMILLTTNYYQLLENISLNQTIQ